MNKSDSITKLATALVKAQSEMGVAKMNAVNPFLKNRYADLGSVIDAVKPVLNKHGISYVQHVSALNERVSVETILLHESGEWLGESISLELGIEKGKSAAQVAGSIITYLRRYSLAAICGIYADEDTDGNATVSKPEKVEKVVTAAPVKTAKTAAWDGAVINAVMQTDARIKAPQHAVAMLKLSKVLDPGTTTPEQAVAWVKRYSAQRELSDDRDYCAAEADKVN